MNAAGRRALQDEIARARARAIAAGAITTEGRDGDHEMIGARCLVDVGGCGSKCPWCGDPIAIDEDGAQARCGCGLP